MKFKHSGFANSCVLNIQLHPITCTDRNSIRVHARRPRSSSLRAGVAQVVLTDGAIDARPAAIGLRAIGEVD